jgi:phosphoglycolate phosphatase-like HAD superfamily hydrolase
VVASSAKKDELESLLKAARVDDLIPRRTTSDDAEQSKPAPDIVEVALKSIDKDPQHVVMLGDTPYDVESAGKAGVGVIAVRCGGHGDQELDGALAIYDDTADVLAHYDESPLSRGTATESPA